MTCRDHLREMLIQRRSYQRGSLEWEWRTRAAIKYAVLLGRMDRARWPG